MPYCPECSASVPEEALSCPTCGSALITTPSAADAPAGAPTLSPEDLKAELAASLAPRYELLKVLGQGGMGAVFLAREPALKRLVAVKLLAPSLAVDATARARFEREARAAAAVSHPNVVRVYAVGETQSRRLPYIVMQYVEGETLAQWMTGRTRVSEREARRIVGQVGSALAAAHARGLVHRDVKPSNILLERESGRAYVADFGVSAALSREQQMEHTKLTATGVVVGTPVYMSPEQAAGDVVGPGSDVYSLGMVAYELLTGDLPYQATSVFGWVAAHLKDAPTPVGTRRPEVSPEVGRLVDRCLAKRPEERPAPNEVARGMLPSLETEIEWPPPGLAEVHGRGARLALGLFVIALFGVIPLILLTFVPPVLQPHAHWLDRFQVAQEVAGQSLRLRATSPVTGEVDFYVWQAALVFTIAVFALGLSYQLWAAGRTLLRVLAHRARGWSWIILIDVLSDHDGRTGLLLAGAREFASLEPVQRDAILRARRWSSAALLGSAGWLIGVVALWAIATAVGLGSGPAAESVGSLATLMLACIPGAAGFAAAIGFQLRERRQLGPLAARRPYVATAEEIARWYETVPGRSAPSATPDFTGRRVLRAAAVAAAVVLAVVAVTALGEIAVVSIAAARFVQRTGPETAARVASLDRLAAGDPLHAARRIMRPYFAAAVALDDSAAVQLLRTLATPGPEPLPAFGVPLARLTELDNALLRATMGRDAVSSDALNQAATLGQHPRTAAFRRLAGAGANAFYVAPFDRPLEQYEGPWLIPILRYGDLRNAARVNAVAALAAFLRGDQAEAMRRLGENAAVGDRLMDVPVAIANIVGVDLWQRSTLRQLASIEERRGRASALAALREASSQLDALTPGGVSGLEGLLVDPSEPTRFAQALLNRAVPVGYRSEIIWAAWTSLCGNPRELLTGPSERRLQIVLAVADSVTDMPYARDLALLAHRAVRRPWTFDAPGESAPIWAFVPWSPWMVAKRLSMC